MLDILQVLSCPVCGGDLWLSEEKLCCSCGYYFKHTDNFYSMPSTGRDDKYASFYTSAYFKSSLYDYTSYRIDKILSFSMTKMGCRVLDVGCGPGEIAVRCAMLGGDVFGIDVSRDALRLSAESGIKRNIKLSLFEFDGRNIPFKDGTFDSIILADVVEHVDDSTLNDLIKECSRLLAAKGRVVIHTSPTKNIIVLTEAIKKLSLNKIDFHSRVVNPDYEFLHIRYHTRRSLMRVLKRNSLFPVIWGDLQYLKGSRLENLLIKLKIQDLFPDQLWCLATKDEACCRIKFKEIPYLGLIDVPSEIDLGDSDDLCLGHGFYNKEFNSFRWTGKAANLFMTIPEDGKEIYLQLHASNPDINKVPLHVSIYIGPDKLSEIYLSDFDIRDYSFRLPKNIKTGTAELKVAVDRTFIPKEFGINEDTRALGVAIHKIGIKN